MIAANPQGYSVCGQPHDMLKAKGEFKNKSCSECAKVKIRKPMVDCLTCNLSFEPGCKIRFICPNCFNDNKKRFELR